MQHAYATQAVFIFTALDLGLLVYQGSEGKYRWMRYVWLVLLPLQLIYVAAVMRGFPIY